VPTPNDDLKDRLVRDRQSKISMAAGRPGGRSRSLDPGLVHVGKHCFQTVAQARIARNGIIPSAFAGPHNMAPLAQETESVNYNSYREDNGKSKGAGSFKTTSPRRLLTSGASG